jgi:membrane-bound inhibitor of C-type lysozyme
MKTSTILAWGVLVIVVVVLALYALDKTYPATYQSIFPMASSTTTTGTTGTTGTNGTAPSGAVSFYCDQGQINATFSKNAVQLDLLPTARYFTLPQVESGSGIRYEATTSGKDELFQSEGDSASLSEDGTAIFSNCVAAHIVDAGNGSKTFMDQSGTFSFTYPDAFSILGTEPGYTQSWMVNTTASGMLLAEVQLPASAQPKTNFDGADFTVGTSADAGAVSACLQATNGEVAAGTVTINGITFDKFTSSSPGAGNLYDTTSYRLVRDSQCYALEYTIHSSQLANYPASAGIKAFNEATVQSQLAGIVTSFKFLQ